MFVAVSSLVIHIVLALAAVALFLMDSYVSVVDTSGDGRGIDEDNQTGTDEEKWTWY